MAEEQAQNGAPDAPEAPTGDVENGAVNDTTPAFTPNEPLPEPAPPEAPQGASSEPARSVSETPTSESSVQTAQIPPSEPLPPELEPIAPAPEPPQAATASAPVAPAPVSTHPARDLLVKARATIQDRKHKKLEKILEALTAKGNITNDEVEKLLHVSDATATRYLSALEKEGKIQQVGKTGKAVEYTRV